jgi:copper chaperone CopZ
MIYQIKIYIPCFNVIVSKVMNEMSKQNEEVRISIGGMHCMGCANRVERALNGKQGVMGVRINLAKAEATIKYNPCKVNLEELGEVINSTGYVPFFPQKGQD